MNGNHDNNENEIDSLNLLRKIKTKPKADTLERPLKLVQLMKIIKTV